jgi:hypothetical protein
MTTEYHQIDDTTIAVASSLAFDKKDWGAPRLMRIFNFTARQVVTLYERGGTQNFSLPRGPHEYSNSTGYTAAVTSSMQMHDFKDLPNPAEIAEMHERLRKMGGNPPPLEDVMKTLGKQTALRSPKPQE